jgi:hypothetical protein
MNSSAVRWLIKAFGNSAATILDHVPRRVSTTLLSGTDT